MATPQDMLEAVNTCLKLDEDFSLTEWEENFIISLEDQVKQGRTLSPKQLERLESIYDKT